MLNLLLISHSAKAEYLRGVLQPMLKVIIDVVPDFDHGLKDVFEKRPSTVCIQDQIAGVTGESVARHIQMLLGTGAPTFILLHDGSAKAKPLKGLFEYVIDLSQPEEKLADEMQHTLKQLLGPQWEKIYIPPKPTFAAIRAAVIPEETRENAEKLVDDFLSDLEVGEFSVAEDERPDFMTTDTHHPAGFATASTADELADLLVQQVTSTVKEEQNAGIATHVVAENGAAKKTAEPVWDDHTPEPEPVVKKAVKELTPTPEEPVTIAEPIVATPLKEQEEEQKPKPVAPEVPVAAPAPAQVVAPEPVVAPKPVIIQAQKKVVPNAEPVRQSPQVQISDFTVSVDKEQAADQLPDDFLLSLEAGLRPKSSPWKAFLVFLLVAAVCVGGVLALKSMKPEVWKTLIAKVFPAGESVQPKVPAPAPVAAPAPAPVQKQPVATAPQPQATSPLPAFVPREGLDRSFGAQKPGWERYVDKTVEYRLFRVDGRIKAVQVVAHRDSVVSESLLSAVLKELVGSKEFKVGVTEKRSGLRVLHATVSKKADVLIYKDRKRIRAFVVAIN